MSTDDQTDPGRDELVVSGDDQRHCTRPGDAELRRDDDAVPLASSRSAQRRRFTTRATVEQLRLGLPPFSSFVNLRLSYSPRATVSLTAVPSSIVVPPRSRAMPEEVCNEFDVGRLVSAAERSLQLATP